MDRECLEILSSLARKDWENELEHYHETRREEEAQRLSQAIIQAEKIDFPRLISSFTLSFLGGLWAMLGALVFLYLGFKSLSVFWVSLVLLIPSISAGLSTFRLSNRLLISNAFTMAGSLMVDMTLLALFPSFAIFFGLPSLSYKFAFLLGHGLCAIAITSGFLMLTRRLANSIGISREVKMYREKLELLRRQTIPDTEMLLDFWFERVFPFLRDKQVALHSQLGYLAESRSESQGILEDLKSRRVPDQEEIERQLLKKIQRIEASRKDTQKALSIIHKLELSFMQNVEKIQRIDQLLHNQLEMREEARQAALEEKRQLDDLQKRIDRALNRPVQLKGSSPDLENVDQSHLESELQGLLQQLKNSLGDSHNFIRAHAELEGLNPEGLEDIKPSSEES